MAGNLSATALLSSGLLLLRTDWSNQLYTILWAHLAPENHGGKWDSGCTHPALATSGEATHKNSELNFSGTDFRITVSGGQRLVLT